MAFEMSNKTVFLSASVPSLRRADRYHILEDATLKIEDAVIAVARAVLGHGGRLVFGGHPSISPLIALIAGEYYEPRPAENRGISVGSPPSGTRVVIYQSRAFEGHLPDATSAMVQAGLVDIHWVPAVNDEQFDPDLFDQPQCRESLDSMRQSMVTETSPDAMVVIGGMEGVEAEVVLFTRLRRGRPIFLLRTTGGAAMLLADNPADINTNIRMPLRILDTDDRLVARQD